MTQFTPRRVWVWMDVSASCNLSCRDCYTKTAHEPILLSMEALARILTRFSRPDIDVRKLHLNWRGEPLINKRLTAMLQMKRALLGKVPLEFHTHGGLVTTSLAIEIVGALSDEDRVYVSVDGGWPEKHEANRGPGSWANAMRGLSMLLEARSRSDKPGPKIGIYEISYDRRTRAHPDLIALGRRCDEWTRVDAIETDGSEASFPTSDIPLGPCFWAGNALCVTASGDAHVCLLSFQPEGRLGNILTDELDMILDQARAFRTKIEAEGRSGITHCQRCRKTEGYLDTDILDG